MSGRGLRSWAVVLLLGLVGCDTDTSGPRPELPETQPSSVFDPTTAGTIRGRVTWSGPLPDVPSFDVPVNALGGEVFRVAQRRPNPNSPRIDPESRGVADVAVFLRGVDPAKARPWDHPPVTVAMMDCRFRVLQGDVESHIGFVRTGDAFTLVSREPGLHVARATGATFFTLAFPDPDRPRTRATRQRGLVELSSAAGYWWMRGYLFVDDHPYFTRTNQAGQFEIASVSPGNYELVCWIPNWRKARHERDPETGEVSRVFFQPPIELCQMVNLESQAVLSVDFAPSDGAASPIRPGEVMAR